MWYEYYREIQQKGMVKLPWDVVRDMNITGKYNWSYFVI
jgi:hypothetical protein